MHNWTKPGILMHYLDSNQNSHWNKNNNIFHKFKETIYPQLINNGKTCHDNVKYKINLWTVLKSEKVALNERRRIRIYSLTKHVKLNCLIILKDLITFALIK